MVKDKELHVACETLFGHRRCIITPDSFYRVYRLRAKICKKEMQMANLQNAYFNNHHVSHR